MLRYVVDGYIRITKREAVKRYDRGEVIYLCPSKLRPGKPWHPECAVAKENYSGSESQYFLAYSNEFEDVVREYTHYNCNYEAGKYPAYYVKEEKR